MDLLNAGCFLNCDSYWRNSLFLKLHHHLIPFNFLSLSTFDIYIEGSHFYEGDAEHPAVTLKTKFSKFTNGSSCSASIYCLSVNAHRPYEVVMGGTSSKIAVYDVR
jgi:hypothetical protein